MHVKKFLKKCWGFLLASVVGAGQKRLLKYEIALKNTCKTSSDILLTFLFKNLIDW